MIKPSAMINFFFFAASNAKIYFLFAGSAAKIFDCKPAKALINDLSQMDGAAHLAQKLQRIMTI
jgi:hypothetical protein